MRVIYICLFAFVLNFVQRTVAIESLSFFLVTFYRTGNIFIYTVRLVGIGWDEGEVERSYIWFKPSVAYVADRSNAVLQYVPSYMFVLVSVSTVYFFIAMLIRVGNSMS